MNTQQDEQLKVSLAAIGIYLSDKHIEKCHHIITDYIKNYRDKAIQDFPIFDSTCILSLIYNHISYSFKVVLCGPNEYAIISGENYSVFKLSRKQDTLYKILWKGKVFNVNIKETKTSFQVVINSNIISNVHKTENSIQTCIPIPFVTDDLPPFSDQQNSMLEKCLSKLHHILNGFILPEPFFLSNLHKELEILFNVLKDPLLPSLQFQNLLGINESSLPSALLTELQQIIAQYISNYSSVFSRFPSKKILLLIDKYLDTIDDQSTKFNMMTILRPILELAEMYSDGIRGHARHMIDNLFEEYRKVEVKFQSEDNLVNMNIINKSISVSDVFSHNCVQEKNKLILLLIEYLERHLPGIIMDLKPTIHKLLNSLNGRLYSQVISKLREILIIGQILPYEVRKNEIEAIFLKSINRYSDSISTTRLESLIYSNSEMFDIICDFFYHKMVDLRKCALEVYIRRAYMAYEIYSFKQSQLSSGQLCVIFQFTRAKSDKHINVPHLKRSNSFIAVNSCPTANYGMKKYSLLNRRTTEKVSHFYLEKDDIPEINNSDFFNEYNLISDKNWNSKPRDNDTDSAISIGAHSLSETIATAFDQGEFDSIGESFGNQNRFSPSAHSLEEIPSINKTSNISLDSLETYKAKRHMSIYSTQLPSSHYDEFLGNLDMGIMVIFNTLDELDRNLKCLDQLISCVELSNYSYYMEHDFLDENKLSSSIYKIVINVAINDLELTAKSDPDVVDILHMFCGKHSDYLNDINVSRITFLIKSLDRRLRYFTFRGKQNFEEDSKLRQIDPALSYQLEINRLCNYHLERLPVLNRHMYVYLATYKVMTVTTTAEFRMFVRCIIYHNEIGSSATDIDYMAREAEKSLVEAMDALDIAWSDGRTSLTCSNHIFFYFYSILCLNKIEELESVVRTIVLKYGHRLWNLRITQAELKLTVKLNSDGLLQIPIRLWVHNEGGKSLDICTYREEILKNSDRKILISWSITKEGRYHGLPVDCFYSV